MILLSVVLAAPRALVGQDCSSVAGQSFEQLQDLSDQYKKHLLLEQERGGAAFHQIWSNADIATKDMYNLNLGLFFGRAEDYEKLVQTLDEADIAFRSRHLTIGLSKTLDIFKQATGLISQIGGVLNPPPYSKIPTNSREAVEFVNNAKTIVKQYAVDEKGQIVALGQTGNAMATLENSNLFQESLRNQIATLQRCMSYAPHKPPAARNNHVMTNQTPVSQPVVSPPIVSPPSDSCSQFQGARQMIQNAWDLCVKTYLSCTASCGTLLGEALYACMRGCGDCGQQWQGQADKALKDYQDCRDQQDQVLGPH